MNNLDPLQVALAGTQLVEASAGTGKTYTIGGLYLRLVAEQRLTVSQILVVTFTKAATAELRQRIRDRLNVFAAALAGRRSDDPFVTDLVRRIGRGRAREEAATRVRQAVADFDSAAIFTIHGYCQRLLAEGAFETGSLFDAEIVPDDQPLVERAVHDFWSGLVPALPVPIASFCRDHGLVPRQLIQLMHDVANDPKLTVLGGDDDPSLGPPLESWLGAWHRARELWREHRTEVMTALDSAELNRNKYRPESVRRWPAEIDAWFSLPSAGRFSDPVGTRRKPTETAKTASRLTPQGLAAGTRKGQRAPEHPFFHAVGELVERDVELAQAAAAFVRRQQRRCIETVFPKLARYKAERGQQSYADLLREVDLALQGEQGEALRRRIADQYRAALIDEFQDTDPTQFRIFRRAWPERRPMFLIGDPKQAIYAFRGADLFAYLRAASASTDRTHGLATNWRSDPGLIAATNALFGRPERAFAIDELVFHPVEARPDARDQLHGDRAFSHPFEVVVVTDQDTWFPQASAAEQACTQQCVTDIAALLQSGLHIDRQSVRAQDIAVLTRSNRQATALQAELANTGISAVLHSNSSVFDTPQADELLRIVAAIDDPQNGAALRAAAATLALGCDAVELAMMPDADFERWTIRFRQAADTWRRSGCYRALDELFAAAGVERRLLGLVGGTRMLTNLLHLSDLLERACSDGRFGPTAALEWLERLRDDARERAAEVGDTSQLRLEDDADAVQILTTHRAKGLEYPIVFCPYVGAGVRKASTWPQFHDAKHDHALTLDLGSPDFDAHTQAAQHEAFAEELRLIYVAVTRAKHRCTLYWSPTCRVSWSALGYLLHYVDAERSASATPASATVPTPSEALETTREHLDQLVRQGPTAIAEDLERLAATAPEQIRVRLATSAAGPEARLSPRSTPVVVGRPRPVTRALQGPWRSSSFSALVHHRRDERDHDAAVPDERAQLHPHLRPRAIESFPGGARAGEFFHQILEAIDFPNRDPDDLLQSIQPLAQRYGFADEPLESVAAAIGDVLDTPLDPHRSVPALRDLDRAQRVDEMPFALPVRHGSPPLEVSLVRRTLAGLGQVPLARYAEALSRLSFPPLAGYLRGYIDLVFEHDDRYFIVDYKSNKLGPGPQAYDATGIWAEMVRHHYPLQYLVYAVALHRHLRLRRRDYDPHRHFGGVYYLFLRGMQPDREAGVFRDPLSAEQLDALDSLFGGRDA
ncbi:MAG: exodeoxyribonuclease V subunit beta [Myxococcales bacterium FL481]|nr:MAG: exodeoxyribonuclease V subunit beta [Myxococcales bacterium FL481]